MSWVVQIICDDKGKVRFIYDKKMNLYEWIGLMEVEIEALKKELANKVKGDKK